ncbi:hypothetical protein BJ170DRAFT_438400 [Xylariales sp. AK1849]|nr:hypothetical protein BJ170DRAFT_438400 [Xylariales sp. AK1849]
MSSETTPISPARFAEALQDLPPSSLALKVFELRNSIAHLDYSNAELKPFAEGRTPTLDSSAANQPDQDCVDAIRENETVIARMQGRIELIKAEVEGRGLSWAEFQGSTDGEKTAETAQVAEEATNGEQQARTTPGRGLTNGLGVNGHAPAAGNGQEHPAWQDGTFTTGTIRGLGDEELMRRLQERVPELQDDEEEDGGMHL